MTTQNTMAVVGEPAFWARLPRPIVGLAPMDGVGDHPFRHIQKKYGNPDLVYTEFTNVEALCHGDMQSLLNLLYDESQRPIIAQIYGRTPALFRQIAILLCELGFDGIDLNMGCPSKSVANGGCGAGLIRTPDLAQTLIRETRAGVEAWRNGATLADCHDLSPRIAVHALAWRERLPAAYQARRPIPVSVKTRIGYESPAVEAWIPRLLEMAPAAITLHGRTLRQAYRGQADWEAIGRAAELAHTTDTLLLGNGDVASLADARWRANSYGVDGVLIGRASWGNPFVFRDEDGGENTDPAATEEMAELRRAQRAQIALEHAQFYEQTLRRFPRYYFLPMRKHLGWYIKDVFHARQLRARLMQSESAEEVATILGMPGVKRGA